jgi:cell division protein FtsL
LQDAARMIAYQRDHLVRQQQAQQTQKAEVLASRISQFEKILALLKVRRALFGFAAVTCP